MTNLKPQVKEKHLTDWEVRIVKSSQVPQPSLQHKIQTNEAAGSDQAFAAHYNDKVFIGFSTEKIRISSDGALAWTAAHEIAHLILRHHRRAEAWSACAKAVGVTIDWESLCFSREHEADTLGMLIAASAGYHPRGAIEALEVMERTNKNYVPQKRGERTHPDVSSTIRIFHTRVMCYIILIQNLAQRQNRGGYEIYA